MCVLTALALPALKHRVNTCTYTQVAAMDHQGMGRSEGHRWYVHAFQHYVDDARAFVTAVHDGVSE